MLFIEGGRKKGAERKVPNWGRGPKIKGSKVETEKRGAFYSILAPDIATNWRVKHFFYIFFSNFPATLILNIGLRIF